MEPRQLFHRVVAIPCLRVNTRRLEHPQVVVMTQGDDGDPAQLGEVADSKHLCHCPPAPPGVPSGAQRCMLDSPGGNYTVSGYLRVNGGFSAHCRSCDGSKVGQQLMGSFYDSFCTRLQMMMPWRTWVHLGALGCTCQAFAEG